MQRPHDTPQAYIKSIEEPELKSMLQTIRTLIRDVAPGAKEGIQHGMLDYPGIGNLAAQKNYVALYVNPKVVDKHRNLIKGVDCGKSCLRFKKPEQIPVDGLRTLLGHVRKHNGA